MRIGAVPYMNAFPLCRALKRPILFAPPSQLDKLMQEGELDLALLPSFSFLQNPSYFSLAEAGVIQSEGPVESVAIFAPFKDLNISSINNIKYTCESVTSINLFKVILKYKFNRDYKSLQRMDSPLSPQLIIGDKALFFGEKGFSKFDLGEAWTQLTGLPFIYALWVARKPVSPDLREELLQARDWGIQNIPTIVSEIRDFPKEKVRTYLTQNIQYQATAQSWEGLKLFQKYCLEMGLLREARTL